MSTVQFEMPLVQLFRGKLKSFFPTTIYRLLPHFFFLFTTFSVLKTLKTTSSFLQHLFPLLLQQTSFFTQKMTSSSLIKRQPQVPSASKLKGSIFRDGPTYVPEPRMQEEKYAIWFSQVLIPYSIACIVHAFMGLLPRLNKKSHNLESFCLSS